ncbi:PREDICTED: methylosome subunit pICln-like [Priapulus caudatus]|uniref:Methylosome subunit pICln n=1 Tax=Priapulus caudatus TaxID=37621 RepID=A0ABM1ENX2_PRICU|nr:PREDICTED: methylosome subunit pICln-like [Priapulus caudatus]XP_014673893.1 PREDICTED: methylosome subunit pICln-like [Priapulus caudatus]
MVVLTTFPPPSDGIVRQEDSCQAYIGNKHLGAGTLYIAESCLSWVGEDSRGFSLEYPDISLHAVSKDVSYFPHECLYLLVNGSLEDKEEGMGDDDSTEEDDGEDDEKTTDVRFVPADKQYLELMFAAMSDCQVLHPDEDDSNSEDDIGVESSVAGQEGDVVLTQQGQATLQRLEAMLQAGQQGNGNVENMDTDGQFDDADQPDH